MESTSVHAGFAYLAIPSKNAHMKDEIFSQALRLVTSPVCASDIISLEFGDNHKLVGREKTMAYFKKIALQHDVFILCGISDGTLIELNVALDARKPIYVLPQTDPRAMEKYAELKDRHGDPLARLRERRILVTLTGKRGAGKTWGSTFAISRFPNDLSRVLSTTSRECRGGDDKDSYHFVNAQSFKKNLDAGVFINADTYKGNHYGTDAIDIERVLGSGKIGIIALTSQGVYDVVKNYGAWATIIPIQVDCEPSLHEKNLIKRGFKNPDERKQLMAGDKSTELDLECLPYYDTLELKDDGDVANIWRFIEALNPYELRKAAQI